MLTEAQREKIKSAYQTGTLKVRSVSPEGTVEWKRVENVIRNEVPWERIVAVTNTVGTGVLTGGHPVYVGLGRGDKVRAEDLKPGDLVLSVVGDSILYLPVLSVTELPPRQFMYDITVEDHHRFVSTTTRNVWGNSPDKFYHFRPPEAEGRLRARHPAIGRRGWFQGAWSSPCIVLLRGTPGTRGRPRRCTTPVRTRHSSAPPSTCRCRKRTPRTPRSGRTSGSRVPHTPHTWGGVLSTRFRGPQPGQ